MRDFAIRYDWFVITRHSPLSYGPNDAWSLRNQSRNERHLPLMDSNVFRGPTVWWISVRYLGSVTLSWKRSSGRDPSSSCQNWIESCRWSKSIYTSSIMIRIIALELKQILLSCPLEIARVSKVRFVCFTRWFCWRLLDNRIGGQKK